MPFKLADLPYAFNALEPYIDKETMAIHHGKHHQAYVDNLNKVLEGYTELLNQSVDKLLKNIDSVPDVIKQAVVNYAGGHANHSFFWQIMTPSTKSGKPEGKLLEALVKTFGSIDKFKEAFTNKAMTVFGSGWTFLVIDKDNNLFLKRHSFQNSPLTRGNIPLLTIDVWEHAYYLKYQNRRLDYINAWWHVVNWKEVEKNYLEAI
jgi:superoxide dismutase, Fe-Mn family